LPAPRPGRTASLGSARHSSAWSGLLRRVVSGCVGLLFGQHLAAECDLLVQLGDRGLEFVPLAPHLGHPPFGHVERPRELRLPLVDEVVESEKLADVFDAKAEALAAQDQLEPAAVAAGEEASLSVADGKQRFRSVVALAREGRHVEGPAHLPDRHQVIAHSWPLQELPARHGRAVQAAAPTIQGKFTRTSVYRSVTKSVT